MERISIRCSWRTNATSGMRNRTTVIDWRRRFVESVAEAEVRASFVDELACLDDASESAPFVHSHRVSFADLPARSVDLAGRVTIAA
jgi:hypothetical protein